ncbi:MAG: TIGR03013 family XrtA/PEP-CTERM system glycosyltransferase [Thermodesulfobacteriota bacterium]
MLNLFKQYYPVRNIVFIIGEGLLIILSVLIACYLLLGLDSFAYDNFILLKCLIITIVIQTCIYYYDLYDQKVTSTYAEIGIRLFQALGTAAIFLGIVYLLFPVLIVGQGIFLVSTGLVLLLIAIWRFGYTVILKKGLFNEKIILLGSGKLAQHIVSEINDKPDCGYTIAMVVTEKDGRDESFSVPAGSHVTIKDIGQVDLCDLSKQLKISKIIVAIKNRRGNFPAKELLQCRVDGFNILEGNTFYEMLTGKIMVDLINPAWLIFSSGFHKSYRKLIIKRIFDIVFSCCLLVVLAPLVALCAIAIKIDSRGPVFFSQERMGEKRRKYVIHKFRSMIHDAETVTGPVWASDKDPRITRVGKIIRKTRIDEIPQIWNVLKGEMSFVGPRPEREHFVKQLEEIIPYYTERMTVKPGITGWAQISYGYGASVEDAIEKLSYDLFYTKNFSILMDIMIVMRTIKIVLCSKGAH